MKDVDHATSRVVAGSVNLFFDKACDEQVG